MSSPTPDATPAQDRTRWTGRHARTGSGAAQDRAAGTGGAVGSRTAAIVLAGGRAARLGGADKASVQVAGRRLIEHVLDAVRDCDPVVVVGPAHLATPGVTVVREDPPFGGPVAALAAGLAALEAGVATRTDAPETTEVHETATAPADAPGRETAAAPADAPGREAATTRGGIDETWLLACDLPRAAEVTARLGTEAIPEHDTGVVLTDADGRPQWLAGRYRIAALRAAVAALPDTNGASMRALLAGWRLHAVDDPVGAAVDLDTWTDIAQYRTTEGKTMADTPADLEAWAADLAAELGLAGQDVPISTLLDLTRDAAHGITRPAGPLTTYLVGLAVANGMSVDDAAAVTRDLIARRTG